MEFLKDVLGEELYGQVAEKLKDGKIKLADLSGGAYVGKDKFDALKAAHDGIAGQLTEANKQIQQFAAMDIDGIKRAADDWKSKAEKAEKDAAARIMEMERDAALKNALAGEKFTSDYAQKGVFDEIKAKNLAFENGSFIGITDVIKSIRETQPAAFAPEKTPAKAVTGITGGTPITGSGADKSAKAPQGMNAFILSSLNKQ